MGVKIHLHCFEYGRGEQPELERYCTEVHYYHRNEGHKGFSHRLPYIVCSRSNQELTDNLLADQYPILLEGIHCTHLLQDPRFENRKILLRLHNVEHEYYRQLFRHEHSFWKKIYYFHESRMLKKYERSISEKVLILAMSRQDAEKYAKEFQIRNIHYLPAFHAFNGLQCKTGSGCFCLYHGNLSVAENEAAAIWLLQYVFSDMDLPFVIAGKNPSEKLQRLAHQNRNTCIVADPAIDEMEDMVRKAQINLTPSFNCTGIKMKLLNALFSGRHCITNQQSVVQSGLENTCHLAGTPEQFKKIIEKLYHTPFLEQDISEREKILSGNYSNEKNALQLIAWLC